MQTLLLTHTDVSRHLEALLLLGELREAFIADANGRTVAPKRVGAPLHAEGTATARFPGAVPGVPAYSVKVNARFPAQAPSPRSLLHLCDLSTGALLAVMDASRLTAIGTSLVAALAADSLARADATRVALIGANAEASLQLKSLRLVRSLRQVFVHDEEPDRAIELSGRLYAALSLPCRPVFTLEEAVADADIVVIAASIPASSFPAGALRPGTHLTVLGAADPSAPALPVDLAPSAALFTDQRDLSGAAAVLDGQGPAELGDVLAGKHPGRQSEAQVTVFAPVGLPLADLVVAWHVYQGARGDAQIQRLDFAG